MGKKGTNGRRTSGITPAQVINELGMRGYKLVTDEQQNQPTVKEYMRCKIDFGN